MIHATACPADGDSAGCVQVGAGERDLLPPRGLLLATERGQGSEGQVRRHLRLHPLHQGAGHHPQTEARTGEAGHHVGTSLQHQFYCPLLIASILCYSLLLRVKITLLSHQSRLTALMSHVVLNEWLAFHNAF